MFSFFGFSSRLVGNLLHICDPLPNEYTTQEVGVSISIYLQISISVSKVSMIYLLVNLLDIFRLGYMRQQDLTVRIYPI